MEENKEIKEPEENKENEVKEEENSPELTEAEKAELEARRAAEEAERAAAEAARRAAEEAKRAERERKRAQRQALQNKRKAEARKNWLKVFNFGANVGETFAKAAFGIAKFFAYGVLYLIAAFLRGFERFRRFSGRFFKNLGKTLASPFVRYHKAFKMASGEIKRARKEKGALAGFGEWLRCAKRAVFGKRGIAVSFFNYGLPVISFVFLFNIVGYATNQTYAIKLTVNGSFMGYISDEMVFTDAEQILQKRINYTGASTDYVSFTPTYEVEMIGYGATLTTYQLTDLMLRLLDKQIDYGFGLYIGDSYYGTLLDSTRTQSVLDSMLNGYRTDNPKENVLFEKEISFIPGLYLSESFVDENKLIGMLTSDKKPAEYYTVSPGDSPESVSRKTQMSIEDLSALNSGFSETSALYVGDRILTARSEPFLNVIISREEHYDEAIQYRTEFTTTEDRFEGFRVITTNGENGISSVVADVSYINGVEVGRRVLSRVTIKSPVTQVIAIGTKPRPEDASTDPTLVEAGKLIWPLGGDGGVYGLGWYEYAGHTGQDIIADRGTPIYAADSGVITKADYGGPSYWNGGYGNLVVITHDNGIQTYYAHCDTLADIYEGQRVTAGELIAYVGDTGYSTCYHLHIEVHQNGRKVDPRPFLPDHRYASWY